MNKDQNQTQQPAQKPTNKDAAQTTKAAPATKAPQTTEQAPTPVAPVVVTPAAQEQKLPPALPEILQRAGIGPLLMQPKKAFIAAGGTEQQFSREVNFAILALMNNTYLIDCATRYPEHFIEAIKSVALTGLTLNPELRMAYLVPYKGKVKFQSSYIGKAEILIRAGVVKFIEAQLVYKNDKFDVIKGTESNIMHRPDYFSKDRGDIVGGYWVAILPNGLKQFDVMPVSRIDEIKQRSEAFKSGKDCPWLSDYAEMAKKTIINWAFKSLPKSNISESTLKVLETENAFENEEFEDWKKSTKSQEVDKFDEAQIIE